MTHLQPDCTACDIISGKATEPGGTLYENTHWHIGAFMGPAIWPGFLIVKLKRHCEHVGDLTVEESALLGPTLTLATRVVTRVLNPAKIFVCSFGDGVKHIHFWILPRPETMRAGMHSVMLNLDFRLFMTRHLHIRKWLPTEEAQQRLADQLRDAFQSLSQIND